MADARYDGFDAIEVLDEVDSTNEELMKRARAGAPEGTALRARVQQSGRGRRSHGWTSPEGGLYLSVLIKPEVPDRVLSGLPVACGIGVANALEQIGCEGVQLKWPNDVVTPRGKLGGILVELGRSSGEKLAVCGLGINYESIKMEWRDPNALPIAGLVDCMPEGSEAPSLDEHRGCWQSGERRCAPYRHQGCLQRAPCLCWRARVRERPRWQRVREWRASRRRFLGPCPRRAF